MHGSQKCENLLGTKIKIRLGIWNVRTMHQTAKTAQILKEMKKYQPDSSGINDCCLKGPGKQITSDGSDILHLGQSEGH